MSAVLSEEEAIMTDVRELYYLYVVPFFKQDRAINAIRRAFLMTESQRLAQIIDEFFENGGFLHLAVDSKHTLYWCVKQLMSRNGLTQKEALDMLGIQEDV